MARFELCVGSEEFWARLSADILGAKRRALVQAMTFEGDRVGLDVARALTASRAEDRRVLVDTFTKYTVSDKFVRSPLHWRDEALHREVTRTDEMFRDLVREGVGVRYTNPMGPLLLRIAVRNHKKLMVADDVAYVGGLNFSEHNFEWHDMMVRIDDRAVVDWLTADFDATWDGKPRTATRRFEQLEILSLDGTDNPEHLDPVLATTLRAERTIDVVSPYLTYPFCDALRDARERGVVVTVLTPAANNKGIIRDYLLWESARSGFDVRLYEGMSHLKAMLIDGRRLVVGSSNFDLVSYFSQAELIAIVDDESLVRDFRARVLDPELARSTAVRARVGPLRGWSSFLGLKVAEGASRLGRVVARHAARGPTPV